MKPEPTIEEQRAFYDRWHSEWRRGTLEEIDPEIRPRSVRVLHNLRRLRLGQPRILHVGCGTGWLTQRLCDFGHVTGIDLSPQAIALAQQRQMSAELIAGDFYEHDFRPALFEAAVCVETLFYVADQARFVQKLASLMGPGGFLILTTINKFVYDRRRDIGPPEHGQVRRWLSKRQVRSLLEPHFEVLSMTTVGEPQGDRGILRLVNSYKLNAVLATMFSAPAVKWAKERLVGTGVVIVARNRGVAN
jgi:2-polyprenyl-3-methyl-5-hydroxy-6-metoxy-1,4-benzoquinol methylase